MQEEIKSQPPAKFHAMYYNFIAKRIRERFDTGQEGDNAIQKLMATVNRATLSDLALVCAEKFKEDNPSFDPIKFLNQCSPDVDLYPLSELWDNRES